MSSAFLPEGELRTARGGSGSATEGSGGPVDGGGGRCRRRWSGEWELLLREGIRGRRRRRRKAKCGGMVGGAVRLVCLFTRRNRARGPGLCLVERNFGPV